MNYGEKISHLRKSKGMTQEELGKVLNVTYQAVSKWERGESLPDFATMSLIAKYFQVPLSYFEDGVEEPQPSAPTPTEIHNHYVTPNIEVPNYIGTCTECGRMLQSEAEVAETSPKLICKTCAQRKRQEYLKAEQAHAEAEKNRRERTLKEELGGGVDKKLVISLILMVLTCIVCMVMYFNDADKDTQIGAGVMLLLFPVIVFAITHAVADLIASIRDTDDGPEGYNLVLSLIVGAASALLFLILFLILYINSEYQIDYLIMLVLSTIISFTFISQYMWGSVVQEIFTAGGFTFKVPGFIFSLTPESILWMIVTKIFLGILSVLFFLLTTVIFAVIAFIGSVLTFVPCLLAKLHHDKKAKSAANKMN